MATLKSNSQWILVARAFWIMFGPLILFACTAVILTSPGAGWRTGADLIYLATLVGMVAGRWVEFLGGHALDSMGDPATKEDVQRYSCWILAGGLALWAVANVVSNHLLA